MLLELMLLQAEAPGPPAVTRQGLNQHHAAATRDSCTLLGSSYDSPPAATATAAVAASSGLCSEWDTEVLVWVSAASNIPLVPG